MRAPALGCELSQGSSRELTAESESRPTSIPAPAPDPVLFRRAPAERRGDDAGHGGDADDEQRAAPAGEAPLLDRREPLCGIATARRAISHEPFRRTS